jgi:hypothetical protein
MLASPTAADVTSSPQATGLPTPRDANSLLGYNNVEASNNPELQNVVARTTEQSEASGTCETKELGLLSIQFTIHYLEIHLWTDKSATQP